MRGFGQLVGHSENGLFPPVVRRHVRNAIWLLPLRGGENRFDPIGPIWIDLSPLPFQNVVVLEGALGASELP